MSITNTNHAAVAGQGSCCFTMHKCFFCLFLLLLVARARLCSQQNSFDQNQSNTMRFFDASGRPFVNPAADYSGSVYFTDSMRSALITLASGQEYGNIRSRIDLLNNEVHYQDNNKTEMLLPAGTVSNIVLLDSSASGVTRDVFRCGFPSIDGQDPAAFYRVMEDGQLVLLEAIRKKIVTDNNAFTGEISKECRTVNEYYVFTGSVIQRLKKNQSSILALMGSRKKAITDYAAANHLNDSSIETIRNLIAKYNLMVKQ